MSEDEQAIREVVAAWQKATGAGKANDLRPLLADDVAFLTAGQPPMTGRDFFVDGLKATFRQLKMKSVAEIREIRVAGDMAYCWTYLTVAITPKGAEKAIVRKGFTLTILRKQASGEWVISRDANLLTTEDDD